MSKGAWTSRDAGVRSFGERIPSRREGQPWRTDPPHIARCTRLVRAVAGLVPPGESAAPAEPENPSAEPGADQASPSPIQSGATRRAQPVGLNRTAPADRA